MIYKKRTAPGIADGTADVSENILHMPKITVYKREEIVPYVTKQVSKRRIKRRLRKSRKRFFLTRAASVFLCFAFMLSFCAFMILRNGEKLPFASENVVFSKAVQKVQSTFSFFDRSDLSQEQSSVTSVTSDKSSFYLSEKQEDCTTVEKGNIKESVSDKSSDIDNPSALSLDSALSSDSGQNQTEETAVTVNKTVADTGGCDGEKLLPITTLCLAPENPFSLSNQTSYTPDIQGLLARKPESLENLTLSDKPLVLIIHTHATECYTSHNNVYPQGEATRTDNTDQNVVRVGKQIKDTLCDFGINAIHCTDLHDKPSFINAYGESADTVRQYLEEYPEIRFVIDVHRDAIIKEDGESVRAVSDVASQDYAQLMFVVGTDEGGYNHPAWQENLCLALHLQRSINEACPDLCRSINLRPVPFNQQLSSGYILLEAGTCANTLEQALFSAEVFASRLAKLILENKS